MTEKKKMVKRAKVILRIGKSYTLAGTRYLSGVPKYIKGSSKIREFQDNGHFNVTMLDSVSSKKKKKSSDDDGKKSSKKTSKKKLAKKKLAKKKVK